MHFQTIISACMMLVVAGCSRNHTSIESAVRANDAHAVRQFIERGSDFRRGADGSDLVYLATGPKGGSDVLRELLKAGASPDGLDPKSPYTPLMNAASWASLESCRLLIDAGADRARIDEAVKVTGRAGGSEQKVIDYLRSRMPEPQAEQAVPPNRPPTPNLKPESSVRGSED
jgi:hypothetical protein